MDIFQSLFDVKKTQSFPPHDEFDNIDSRYDHNHTHMVSKRLQVLIDEAELKEIQVLATQEQMTVADWVRRALRTARQAQPRMNPHSKLEVVRRVIQYDFPTSDMDQMLGEIESGYGSE